MKRFDVYAKVKISLGNAMLIVRNVHALDHDAAEAKVIQWVKDQWRGDEVQAKVVAIQEVSDDQVLPGDLAR